MIFTMRYYHDQATTLMDAATKIRRQKNEDVQAFDARRRKHQLDVENAIEGLKLSAKEAAPYIHPRLATLQSNVNLTGRLTLEALVMQSLPQPANGNATLAIEGEVGEQAQIAAE